MIHRVQRYRAKRSRAKQRYRATFFGLNLVRYRFQGRKFTKLYRSCSFYNHLFLHISKIDQVNFNHYQK